MNILVLNGPNLNLLGIREPSFYGDLSIRDLEETVISYGEQLGLRVGCFQSNSEGELIERLHCAMELSDGIVLNAGAYSHYSYALRDAIVAISIPVVEVHISNIYAREDFRHKSVIAPVCMGQISGFGVESYKLALDLFSRLEQ